MDAAHTNFTKISLFLSIALLATPFAAQAQPSFSYPNGATATVNGNQPGCTQVNSSTSTPITFNVTQPTGSPQFYVSPAPTGNTTPVQICFNIANAGVTPGVQSSNVTLTATSPAGVAASSITVTFNPSGTGGGGGGNTGSGLTSSANTLSMSSTLGSFGSASFNLSNNTNAAITVSSIVPTYQAGQASGWLSLSQSSGSVPANAYSVINISGNPSGLANTTYNATLTVTYSGGTITIPVTFVVANNTGGSGSITASPNPVNLNYVTGSGVPPSQFVTLGSSAGTISYDATITSGLSWLLINGQSAVQGYTLASGLSITTILNNLPTSNATGSITITDSNNSNNTLVLPVNLTINGQSNNGLTLTPNPITLSASVGQTTQASAILTVTSTTTGSLSLSTSGTGISAVLAGSSITAGGSQSVTVYGNPTGLVANTYQGTVTVTLNGVTSSTANVNFTVGQGSGTVSGTVAPTSLQFNYQQGQSSSLIAQYVTDSVSGNFTTSVTSGGTWLTVTPSGTGPGLITVSAANVASMSVGTYNGAFTVTTPSGTQTVNASLLISGTNSPVVFANPGILNIPFTAGSSNPNTTFQVFASDGSNIVVSASSSQSWLTVQQLNSATPASFLLTINGAGLPNGINLANVNISSNAANGSLTVPVVLSVTGSTASGTLTLGSSAFTFNAATNGTAPASQTLSVSASANTAYTASASVQTGGTSWLSISPSGSLTTSANPTLTVSVNQAGLNAGNYSGNISLVTSSGTQNVPVTLVVTAGGGGNTGNVTVSPTSLTFNYSAGGSLPGSQGFNVTSSAGTVSYSVSVTTQSGGGWLSTNVTSGFTPSPVSVSVSPSGLAGGTYSGTVIISPSGGTTVNVPITLVVQGLPTVSASPATLSLTYQAGSANTPTGTIQVSGSAASLGFTAAAVSTGGWLSVSPTTGDTGASGTALNVSVNPAGLTAGTYTGTIVVAGANGAAGSSTTTVTLTVSAPLPTISAVQNAASGASGAVAPGEIVSIFAPAANPIGPGTPAGLTLDTNGNVSTTLAGVQVLFNGTPAPLTYVSSTQINAVVPYNVAGLTFPYVQVKYLGQSSNAFNLTTTATLPGIFTQNGSGSGPGAILNQDASTNGPTHPATKGSVVVVYMTGEGATSPAGVTGKVNCPAGSACSISQLPVPLLPVSVTLVDNNGARYPANFIFAGEAPGFVSGVMQVNVVIPTNVPSGNLQILVGVGGNTSQAGVTVSVQ